MHACAGGHPDIVALLLGHGADPFVVSTDGWGTACKIAEEKGHRDCVAVFAKRASLLKKRRKQK
jgi:ankyrin repeat protein